MRRAAKIDINQKQLVKDLRKLPGVTVEVNHHDILCGFRNFTMWYEIKNEDQRSKKTNRIYEAAKTERQRKLDREYTGHREYVTTFEEILADITKHTMG